MEIDHHRRREHVHSAAADARRALEATTSSAVPLSLGLIIQA
jgi:hypothetical protein